MNRIVTRRSFGDGSSKPSKIRGRFRDGWSERSQTCGLLEKDSSIQSETVGFWEMTREQTIQKNHSSNL